MKWLVALDSGLLPGGYALNGPDPLRMTTDVRPILSAGGSASLEAGTGGERLGRCHQLCNVRFS